MTDLELDAFAEGLFKYLSSATAEPLDAIAVLGITLLKIHARATDGTVPIAKFAEDIRRSLIESHAAQSAQGTETRQ